MPCNLCGKDAVIQGAQTKAKKQVKKTRAFAQNLAKRAQDNLKATAKKMGLGAKKAKRIGKLAKAIAKKNTKKVLKSWGKIKKQGSGAFKAARKEAKNAVAKAKKKIGIVGKKMRSAFNTLWKVLQDNGMSVQMPMACKTHSCMTVWLSECMHTRAGCSKEGEKADKEDGSLGQETSKEGFSSREGHCC